MGEQVKNNTLFLDIAEIYARQSKCISINVGCIVTNGDDRIIASGVNGSLPGFENCCDHDFEQRSDHHEWSQENEIHGEMNAILELATSSKSPSSLNFYVTHSPCKNCFKHILGLRRNGFTINNIVFRTIYHRTLEKDINGMIEQCNRLNIGIYHENKKLCSKT